MRENKDMKRGKKYGTRQRDAWYCKALHLIFLFRKEIFVFGGSI
jgi:hypothetical protein